MQVDNSCIHLSIYDQFNEIPKKCITSTMKGAVNLYNQSFKVERENRNTDHQVTSTNRLLLWHYVLRNVLGICTDWHDTHKTKKIILLFSGIVFNEFAILSQSLNTFTTKV